MGVVCAEDANQTAQDTLQITDTQDVISNSSEKSYDDLFKIIDESDDSITLESDYKYKETDRIKFISFEKINYVIDGNNHAIDADGKTLMFKVAGGNLTLKNLVFKNTKDSAIQLESGLLNTVNVTFINANSQDFGGAVYASNGYYYSTNDKFIDNSAKDGGSAIFGKNSGIYINNGTFTSKNPVQWGLIYGSKCDIGVSDSIFANTTSKYATAIYNTFSTTIKKSKFVNLTATATAGAIAVKNQDKSAAVGLIIYDSEFTNITAARNGGAIFADTQAEENNNGFVRILRSKFDSNNAEFGAAVLQLGGNFSAHDSVFTNNIASESGGAIFTSHSIVNIEGSTFTNNKAHESDGWGGAVYLDYETATIDNSTFTDNVAGKGGAIYSLATLYKIKNSQFKNNDIFTRFDDDGSSITNCGNYSATINDQEITYLKRYSGEEIILNPQTITGSAKDSYFNLNNLGLVTPVKDQGNMGSCWAFGAAGAFESSYLIATGKEIDISENNIQNLGLPYSEYGQTKENEGGTMSMAASYFVSWLGAINTTGDSYDELGKVSALQYGPNAIRTVDAVYINIQDKNAIKQFLTKYGAMNLFVYGANSHDKSYSNKYKSVYNSRYYGNHYVTLVGWDDNFSKNKFSTKAPGNGAWICKNSWGTGWGDGGFFYISYYDKSLTSDAVGFTFDNVEHYETLYQNEVNGWFSYDDEVDTYGQIFTSESGDIIAAVGTYFENAKTKYTISIFLNNSLAYSQSGKSTHAGYETVKLNKYIAVDPNSTFEIRITSSSVPIVDNTRSIFVSGVNYVFDGNKVIDLAKLNKIAPIKAYTYHSPLITKGVEKHYDHNETIFTVFNVTEADSIPASFNNANYTIDIVNGTGSISLGVLPGGEYLVTVTYKNQTFSSHVIVRPSIRVADEKTLVWAYGASGSVPVQFFDLNENPLKNTVVSAKFDNKIISDAKTNEKGILTIPIKAKNSIGKHYLDFVNPNTGEKVRITVNIVSRFVGNADINMYYFDGHKYKVRVKDNNGNFVGKNQVVTIKIGKKSFKVKTDANGYAILKIPSKITPGKYKVYATYKGQTVKNKLTVKQVLKTTKTVNVKKSAKKLVLKATLKKGKTAIKSKVVKFKVNGKTYKAKTSKYGIAKVTIKKAAINKLKVGKKYAIKVSYLSDVVKATLKVRR